MLYEIWNWGATRTLPYKSEGVELLQSSGINTRDREMAEALGKFPFISVKELTRYEDLPMKELNKMAGKKGINPFGIKKKELIAKLREVEKNEKRSKRN